jgi:hypothetical protein
LSLPDYAVIDLETSVRNRGDDAIGDFSGDPHHPDNQIVSAGWSNTVNYAGYYYTSRGWPGDFLAYTAAFDLWVGQNFKFDMLYMMRCVPGFLEILHTKKVWDTQAVEYLLTGMESKYAHLNDLSAKYGGTQKVDKMKEYWDAGCDTEDIPKDELMEYMQYDVLNTEIVFLAQYQQVMELGILPLVESQMEALLATTEMEYNGMCFDRGLALTHAEEVEGFLRLPLARVMAALEAGLPYPNPSPGSVDHVSHLLFGGEYKRPIQVPWLKADGTQWITKAGVHRVRNGTEVVQIKGWFAPDAKWKANKKGYYSVDDFTLSQVKARTSQAHVIQFINDLLEVRNYQKELNTYLYGFADVAWPEAGKHFIHGKIGHCGTVTGRTNSSKPNLQNLSGREE